MTLTVNQVYRNGRGDKITIIAEGSNCEEGDYFVGIADLGIAGQYVSQYGPTGCRLDECHDAYNIVLPATLVRLSEVIEVLHHRKRDRDQAADVALVISDLVQLETTT